MPQIQPGTYSCVVTSSHLIPPKEAGGHVQLSVGVEVDVPDESGGNVAVPWTYFATFSDKSYDTFIAKMLTDIGWNPAENDFAFDLLDTGDQSPLVGKEARAVFQMDDYNGTQKLKLRFLNGPGGGAFVPKERMAPEDAKAFAARMRAKLGGGRPPATRPASAAPPARPPAATSRPAAAAPARQASSAGEALRTAAPPQRFDEETVARAKAADVNFDDIPF